MALKQSVFWKILTSRALWAFILVLAVTSAWQAWSSVARQVLTHELMGRASDVNEVRLLFVGDTGFGNSEQKAVAEQLEQICNSQNPDGVIFLGDNFYYNGVASVTDELWDSRFESMYAGECLRRKTFYAILGNHDYSGVADAQIDYTRSRAGRWLMPARYFSLRFGELLEIGAADTTIADRCGMPSLCSIDWLIEKLKSSNARWKILVGHHPMLSGGKYRRLTGLRRLTLPPLFCESGAHAYISGHDHNLQHLSGKPAGADCEIEQFVSGGGGAPIYAPDKIPNRTHFALAAHGVLMGRYSRHEQRYEFFSLGRAEPVYTWTRKQEP